MGDEEPAASAAASGWFANAIIVIGIALFVALPVGLIVGGLQTKPHVEAIPGGL